MKRIAIPTLLVCVLSVLTSAAASAAPRAFRLPVMEPSRSDVRAALARRRALQLQRLRAYRDRGVFPRNRVSDDVINVFRDENGLLCAVANLVFLDGDLELVASTAKENNYVKMATLKKGALFNWILASGFTIEEIGAIQLPDSPVVDDFDWEQRENARIIAHINAVSAQMIKDTEASLDAATDRLIASGRAWTVVRQAR